MHDDEAQEPRLPEAITSAEPQAVLDAVVDRTRLALDRGENAHAMRMLLAAFARIRTMQPRTLHEPRASIGIARWDTLVAAGARFALRGRPQLPQWTERRLERPWFPQEGRGIMPDDYRAFTIRRTVPEFARANIFLTERALKADPDATAVQPPGDQRGDGK